MNWAAAGSLRARIPGPSHCRFFAGANGDDAGEDGFGERAGQFKIEVRGYFVPVRQSNPLSNFELAAAAPNPCSPRRRRSRAKN